MLPSACGCPEQSAPQPAEARVRHGGLVPFLESGNGGSRTVPPCARRRLILALSGAELWRLLGLVGTDWPRSKIARSLRACTSVAPSHQGLAATIRGRVPPNEVAGALVMLLPLLAAGASAWRLSRRAGGPAPLALADAACCARRLPAVLLRRVRDAGRPALGLLTMLAASVLRSPIAWRDRRPGPRAWPLMLMLRQPHAGLLVLPGGPGRASGTARCGRRRAHRPLRRGRGSADSLPSGASQRLATADALTKVGRARSAAATGRVGMWGNALRALSDYPAHRHRPSHIPAPSHGPTTSIPR